jgi:hypothetical protein
LDLFLDDKKVEDNGVVGGTLEQTLREVQINLCPPRRILVGFRCDGEEIVSAAIAAAMQRPVASFEKLEVFTSTREDLVAETMGQASSSLEETESTTQRVAELLMEGKTVEGIERLGECLHVWQQVHDAVAKSLELLRLDPQKTKVRDQPLLAALEKPKDVLLQIKGALQAQDHVLLADILQYEFAEVTDMWHTMIGRIRQEADDRRAADVEST